MVVESKATSPEVIIPDSKSTANDANDDIDEDRSNGNGNGGDSSGGEEIENVHRLPDKINHLKSFQLNINLLQLFSVHFQSNKTLFQLLFIDFNSFSMHSTIFNPLTTKGNK